LGEQRLDRADILPLPAGQGRPTISPFARCPAGEIVHVVSRALAASSAICGR
jgi:hypothetical protein